MPDTVVRFPANVPYVKWPEAYKFFQACYQGKWAEAQQLWNASTPTGGGATYITDAVGAVEMGYQNYQPSGGFPVVLESGELTHGNPVGFDTKPGKASAFKSLVDGLASASIGEGGQGLYGMVSDTLPTAIEQEQFTTWGKVAVEGLAIKAGQYLVVFSQSPTALAGRADTRV